MAAGEFELIARYFADVGSPRRDVDLGIGDDATLLDTGGASRLITAWASSGAESTRDAEALGERCTEAAIDELKAQGASPAWLTLALTMERADAAWLAALTAGLQRACDRHHVRLVGGDTTAGPTAITVFATGIVQ